MVERLGLKFHLYRIRYEHGVLDKCYGEGDLELFTGQLKLAVEGWEASHLLSLREAAKFLNPHNSFQGMTCSCKSGYNTNRCACWKKNATCSSKCHQGLSCTNAPPSKKMKHTEPMWTSLILPFLNMDQNDLKALMSRRWLSDKHICAVQDLLKKQFPTIPGL